MWHRGFKSNCSSSEICFFELSAPRIIILANRIHALVRVSDWICISLQLKNHELMACNDTSPMRYKWDMKKPPLWAKLDFSWGLWKRMKPQEIICPHYVSFLSCWQCHHHPKRTPTLLWVCECAICISSLNWDSFAQCASVLCCIWMLLP